jgi:hypothetical protein
MIAMIHSPTALAITYTFARWSDMKNVGVGQIVVFTNGNIRVPGIVRAAYTSGGGEDLAIIGLGSGPGEPSIVLYVKELSEPTEADVAKFHQERAAVEAALGRGYALMKTLDKCEAAADDYI